MLWFTKPANMDVNTAGFKNKENTTMHFIRKETCSSCVSGGQDNWQGKLKNKSAWANMCSNNNELLATNIRQMTKKNTTLHKTYL